MVALAPNSDLAQSRIWSGFSLAYFVPVSDIKYYTKRSRVAHTLDQVIPLQSRRDILLERVLKMATRIYCILLYIGQIDSLENMLAVGFSDSKLPLLDGATLLDLCATINWNQDVVAQFMEAQWLFLAPCFEKADSSISLLPEMPLPFVWVAPDTKIARHSTIKQIQIHEAHQNILKPMQTSRPMLALKLFQPSKTQRFERELKVLRILRQAQSNNIIELVASFSSCASHGLLFAWADMSLREFFATEMNKVEEMTMEAWILSQMIGLVEGLSVIHQCHKLHDGSIWYGRHGDLHPLNILLISLTNNSTIGIKATLKLSSMGEVRFFRSTEDFDIPQNVGMYEAPECQLARPAGPLYDVWSLGCIFLEMLIWLSEGPQGVKQFALARLSPDPIYGDLAYDDYFFTLKAKEGLYVGAEVRPSVKDWVNRCANHWRASRIFSNVVSIIEEHMLQPCPNRRLASYAIYSKLQALIE